MKNSSVSKTTEPMTRVSIDRRRVLLGGAAAAAVLGLSRWPRSARAQNAAGAVVPLAQRLAAYASALTYADIDTATLETLRIHLVDTFGCALGALGEAPVVMAHKVAESSGGGRATLIGSNRRTTAELAAFANGAAIRFLDLNDDYAGKETGHPSDLISGCLAVAQTEARSISDFIVSVILVYEIECRLFDAMGLTPLGWDHPTYSVISSALGAGKLMRLSVDQLTQAVNIALVDNIAMNQTRTGVISLWKGLADADATRKGIFAAVLARAGVTGPSPIFEGRAGFEKQVVGSSMNIDTAMFGGNGQRFRINDCGIKPFPAQGMTISAAIAAMKISQHIANKDAIASVSIATSEMAFRTAAAEPSKWAPATRGTADHSLPYVVARALLDGEITDKSYSDMKLADPTIKALLAKTKAVVDPALSAMFPVKQANRVTVVLTTGETLTEQVDDFAGSPTNPLSRADVEAKFWRTVGPDVSRIRGKRLIQRIWTLDTTSSVDELMATAANGT
jgi:2-methylcitrate dehydratase